MHPVVTAAIIALISICTISAVIAKFVKNKFYRYVLTVILFFGTLAVMWVWIFEQIQGLK